MTEDQQALWGIDLLNVPRSDIPAVTHVDYSARIQTVHQESNPHYYQLLKVAYLNIKAVDRSNQVIMAGLAYWFNPSFLDELLKLDPVGT